MNKQILRDMRRNVRLHVVAHHFVFHSKSAREVGKVANLSPKRIVRWCKTSQWRNALKLWGYTGCPYFKDYYDFVDGSFADIEEKWLCRFEVPEMETVTYIDIIGG